MIRYQIMKNIYKKSGIINPDVFSMKNLATALRNIGDDGRIVVSELFWIRYSHLLGRDSPAYYRNIPFHFDLKSRWAIVENCPRIKNNKFMPIKKYIISKMQCIMKSIHAEEVIYVNNPFNFPKSRTYLTRYIFTKFKGVRRMNV